MIGNAIAGLSFFLFLGVSWGAIFGTVTSLPFQMEESVQIISNALHSVVSIMPLLSAPLEAFFWILTFKILLFTVDKTLWFIQLVRG